MDKKIIDTIKSVLEPTEGIVHDYDASSDGQSGRILLSDKKLLFVREKGFLKKTYDLITDLAYNQIDTITRTGSTLTLSKGEESHSFTSGFASRIEEDLKKLKQSKIKA